MPAQVLTTDDLYQFKLELLEEIRTLFDQSKQAQNKKWLKSAEVRSLLKISPGTLQTLRLNGTLPHTKIGGTLYYSAVDIDKVLSQNLYVQKTFL